ncbi:MAG TPA: RNA 2',3'-cyclic phosphodiesterase [Candidatus Desulfofervidus auxilii]|uniref:RNA 2',3'-cyclic phosphodiesterase n=1 Tax=Desulfofervidus auxilii TaxID=1621989 RepID=A0A7C0Y2F6_DESA2|nr:RNA 2',3'-cyclic phosphodiesterase [Candidatus Desulfofervidus auxilii]
MIRTFIAIPLPENVIESLTDLIEKLKPILPKVSWVKPHNIHLTLKFLGNIQENETLKIKQAIEESSFKIKYFSLSGYSLSVFPNIKRARVIWTGLKGDLDILKKLHNDLEEKLNILGFPKEDRAFTPHLTLGRIKKAINSQILANTLKKHTDFSTPSFIVKEIVLFRSDLNPKGAIYTPLEKVFLRE